MYAPGRRDSSEGRVEGGGAWGGGPRRGLDERARDAEGIQPDPAVPARLEPGLPLAHEGGEGGLMCGPREERGASQLLQPGDEAAAFSDVGERRPREPELGPAAKSRDPTAVGPVFEALDHMGGTVRRDITPPAPDRQRHGTVMPHGEAAMEEVHDALVLDGRSSIEQGPLAIEREPGVATQPLERRLPRVHIDPFVHGPLPAPRRPRRPADVSPRVGTPTHPRK